MFEIKGKKNTAICYATVVENEAIEQVRHMCDYELTEGSKVRIMPDVHAGKGCTIGTTMTVKDNKTILIAGILCTLIIITIALLVSGNKKSEIDFDELSDEELDAIINEEIDDMEIKELASMEERDRMEWYVSKFIKNVEAGAYDDAYDVLNEEFKTRYFKTISKDFICK